MLTRPSLSHGPLSDAKPDASTPAEKPLTNGKEDHESSNGVTKDDDVTMGNGEDKDLAKSDAKPSEATPSASDKKPEETEKDDAASTEAQKDEAAKSNDVEMTDSDAVKDKSATPKPEAAQAEEKTEKDDSAAKEDSKEKSEPESKEAPKETAAPEDSQKSKGDETEKPSDAPASSQGASQSELDLRPASISQLALDTQEAASSPIEPSVEVTMTDAPASKQSREREDDAAEEPAPKRARTEPKDEEEVTMGTSADGQEIAVQAEFPVPTFDEFADWLDPENSAKVISVYRKREMRRTVARVKKTKHGNMFRDSVQRLWPQVWDKYVLKIDRPMDLSEIDRNLRDDKYKTFGDFKGDLGLLLINSQAYNGPDHYITLAARGASRTVWEDVYALPEEEPAKPKPLPKTNRVREPRQVNVKPEPAAPVAAAPTAAPAASSASPAPTASASAKPAHASSEARRGSGANDGDRPKRTVRAPKPKDIDYTAKPSRKKLKPELQFCDEVLAELVNPKKHWQNNRWFIDAVDAEGLGIPHYYSIITHPMDLGKIQRMLAGGEINSVKEFDKNVQLMFNNCYKFNGPPEQGDLVALAAKGLQDTYTDLMKNKDSWLAKHAKAHPPPASVSNPSDDEEEDEEDDAGDAAAVADHVREVKDLEARLREEMDKQANLFAAEQPNPSMIQIQQGIVNMVQEALLKAKTKLHEVKQKSGGASKPKKAKPAKAKAAGGAGSAKAPRAPQPKKPSGAKNKKKNLSAADKDHIAGAINDLEYPHLDRAIDIIKRDTGQMVRNTDMHFSCEVLLTLLSRRAKMASLNLISTNLATRPFSSCGSCARRCFQVSPKMPKRLLTLHQRCSGQLQPSRRPRQRPSLRRTSQ